MYKVLKVNKTDHTYTVLVQHSKLKIKMWMIGTFKNNEIDFKWRDEQFNLNKNKELIRMLLQSNEAECIDAGSSALCELEYRNYVTVDEFGNISEVN